MKKTKGASRATREGETGQSLSTVEIDDSNTVVAFEAFVLMF